MIKKARLSRKLRLLRLRFPGAYQQRPFFESCTCIAGFSCLVRFTNELSPIELLFHFQLRGGSGIGRAAVSNAFLSTLGPSCFLSSPPPLPIPTEPTSSSSSPSPPIKPPFSTLIPSVSPLVSLFFFLFLCFLSLFLSDSLFDSHPWNPLIRRLCEYASNLKEEGARSSCAFLAITIRFPPFFNVWYPERGECGEIIYFDLHFYFLVIILASIFRIWGKNFESGICWRGILIIYIELGSVCVQCQREKPYIAYNFCAKNTLNLFNFFHGMIRKKGMKWFRKIL